MVQKILVAMDDSENAMRAVRFVARSLPRDNEITLFNVVLDTATLCGLDSPELSPLFKTEQSQFCTLEAKKREMVTRMLQQAKEALVVAGFSADRIRIKLQEKNKGVARDIIKESEGYDLLVLGRHGKTAVKDFLLGSTSQKVFSGVREIPVLIVN
jgi:nucleotide-binding universal stress UspA family protein